MTLWPARIAMVVVIAVLVLGFVFILAGGGQSIANAASYMGGIFALLAIWLYLQPVAVCTLDPYEYIPGTSTSRLFKLSVRNAGNVPVRIVQFIEHFQSDPPPPSRTEYTRYFEGKTLNRQAEVPVWIPEAEMSQRKGFTVRYKGWLPWTRETTCHLAPFGVTHYVTVTATAHGKASVTAMVERATEKKPEGHEERPN